MRMWMIDPEKMCMQHIVGEHRELHALKGSIERTKPRYSNHKKHKKKITSLAKDRIIEPKSLKKRHKELVEYLDNHESPIGEIPTFKYLPEEVIEAEVDKEKAIQDLIDRPEACRPKNECRKNLKS